MQAYHRRAPINQSRNAHAVVERMRLGSHDVDRAIRVTPAYMVGGGNPCDPVAEHNNPFDGRVKPEALNLRCPADRGMLRGEGDCDWSANLCSTGHPRPVRQA